jgi:ribosomal protein S10
VSGELLLPIAATASALGGLFATIAAVRATKKNTLEKAEADCHERLLAAHRESQDLIDELTRLHREAGGR